MPLRHFEIFTETISTLPPEAILRALDLECKTLEDDLEFHRSLPDDAFSIMCFRQFVRLGKQGEVMMRCITPLPPEHVKFYKETAIRLIKAGILPPPTLEQFDQMFHSIL